MINTVNKSVFPISLTHLQSQHVAFVISTYVPYTKDKTSKLTSNVK